MLYIILVVEIRCGDIMVNRIIKEVQLALDNECYIVALMGALILPDICGKSAYPNLGVGERYRNWCDTYVYPKIQHADEDGEILDCGITDLCGKVIYSLRCCLLHQGSADIEGEKCEVEDFELLIQPKINLIFTLITLVWFGLTIILNTGSGILACISGISVGIFVMLRNCIIKIIRMNLDLLSIK